MRCIHSFIVIHGCIVQMNSPYSWQPNVVDTQLFRIGQLLILAVPGEFTTMSGRRLHEAILKVSTTGLTPLNL